MQLQEFKDDFLGQLEQEQLKLQELTHKILKLQGACEAVDLMINHYSAKETLDVIDVETIKQELPIDFNNTSPTRLKKSKPSVEPDFINA